jgi:hypothetical protein
MNGGGGVSFRVDAIAQAADYDPDRRLEIAALAISFYAFGGLYALLVSRACFIAASASVAGLNTIVWNFEKAPVAAATGRSGCEVPRLCKKPPEAAHFDPMSAFPTSVRTG